MQNFLYSVEIANLKLSPYADRKYNYVWPKMKIKQEVELKKMKIIEKKTTNLRVDPGEILNVFLELVVEAVC